MAAVFLALHQNFVSTASAVFTQLWFKSTYSINHTPNEIKGKSRTPSRRMPPANTPLEELSVRQLKTLLKQKGLPISGRKAELIERLIGPQSNINPAPPLKPINPAPPLKSSHPMPLEQMKVPQLKSLLKLRGLPVSGKKAELIERLKNGASGGPKPKPWQHSSAKKDLKRALLDHMSPIHGMTVEGVKQSDERYQKYPNFKKYYNVLKAQVEAEKMQVKEDDIAVETHIRNNPRSALNKRGYPHWDTHAAKQLLEVDVANGAHQRMKPN